MNCLKTIPIKMNCLKTIPIKMNCLKTIPIKMNCLKTIPKLSISQLNVPPKCINCKYSISQGRDTGCKLFSNMFDEDFGIRYYISTFDCRNNIDMCGPIGKYFKPKQF